MTNPMYLTGAELGIMKNDWASLLNSPEATTITFEYKVGSGAMTSDDAFGIDDYAEGNETQSFTGKVIQEIVKPQDEALLKWGILEQGDCIFYMSKTLDLTAGIEGSMELLAPGDVRWSPVPRKLGAFYNYLLTRLGNTQLAQVIPCKLKQ